MILKSLKELIHTFLKNNNFCQKVIFDFPNILTQFIHQKIHVLFFSESL